jgi:hypothetical protein
MEAGNPKYAAKLCNRIPALKLLLFQLCNEEPLQLQGVMHLSAMQIAPMQDSCLCIPHVAFPYVHCKHGAC